MEDKKKRKLKSKDDKVRLNIRLDDQVEFGQHIVILGSTKELGSWTKNVPLNWTESGWVCDLEFKGGESIEFKFVIVDKDGSKLWEKGDNRVIEMPKRGTFGIVCHWDTTGESLDLVAFEEEEEEEELGDVGENGSTIADTDTDADLEVEMSPFVGQWQGKAASFMRSNEHRDREKERTWDTSGLKGLALKLVEGDRNARNWWRKVSQLFLVLRF